MRRLYSSSLCLLEAMKSPPFWIQPVWRPVSSSRSLLITFLVWAKSSTSTSLGRSCHSSPVGTQSLQMCQTSTQDARYSERTARVCSLNVQQTNPSLISLILMTSVNSSKSGACTLSIYPYFLGYLQCATWCQLSVCLSPGELRWSSPF